MFETNQGGGTTRVGNWDRPAHHQCAHVMESGVRCQASTATGKKLCHAHQRYGESDPLYPCQVPLLEDASSIRFVISQTNRQLAMGAIPPANGRAMLYGCRMALDLLLYEQAQERRRMMEEKKLAEASQRAAELDGQRGSELVSQPVSELASQPVSGLASQPASELATGELKSAGSVESHICENRADVGHPWIGAPSPGAVEICAACEEPELQAEAEPKPEPLPFVRRREPRFPHLRREWDEAMDRGHREVSANRGPMADEDFEFWRQRMDGPLQAGHPQTRQVHPYMQNAIAVGRSADASAYGDRPVSELGPRELPFNPAFPPRSPEMEDWREEHIAAWYRCLIPTATEKEARAYASHNYNAMHKDQAEAAMPEAERGTFSEGLLARDV